MNTNTYPAVITVPSWVIAGTYAENLRFLKDKKEIKGVELLFFLFNNEVKEQLDAEWEEIQRFGRRFIFTAHLPEQLLPAHSGLVARLTPLVRHFIVHPFTEDPSSQVRLLAEWTNRFGISFVMENTNPGMLDILLPFLEPNAGLCMDTGHLLVEEKNPSDFFKKYRDRIKEIHLHGIDKEQAIIDKRLVDHRQLRKNEPWLTELLPLLEDYSGIINLEVFSWEEANAGIKVLTDF